MELAEIITKKRDGDMQTAAEIVGITPANARQALKRPDSKHHKAVVSALETLIITRDILIQQGA